MNYQSNLKIQNKEKLENITEEIVSVTSMTSTIRVSREKTGMLLAFIATFFYH